MCIQSNIYLQFSAPNSERCVSWDFALQDWTQRGCVTSVGQDGIVTCICDHLTNFCMLVVCHMHDFTPTGVMCVYTHTHTHTQDICSRQEDCLPSNVEFILTYVSYIGMPISIVCLVLTMITLIILM